MVPLISVIIVNYKSEHYLYKCVASILDRLENKIDFEIIIVNNDAAASLPKFQEASDRITLVQSKKNLGFGGGSNLGAAQARGEILLFLNPDAELQSDNIAEVCRLFDSPQSAGIVGSLILDKNMAVQPWSAGYEISLKNLIRNNLSLAKSARIWNSPTKISADWVSGTALFIKKKLFSGLNGFDESFFMYFEDMDLCRRARQAGYPVIYYPSFRVSHAGGMSYGNRLNQKNDYYLSQEKYFKKHRPFYEWLAVKMLRSFY